MRLLTRATPSERKTEELQWGKEGSKGRRVGRSQPSLWTMGVGVGVAVGVGDGWWW